MTSSAGIEVMTDPSGTRVKIREIGEDGKETVREYSGKDLDEIRRNHPEVAERLSGFSVRIETRPFDSPPRIFRWRDLRRGLAPRAPAPPAPPPLPGEPHGIQGPFGLSVQQPLEETLAVHLGVDPKASLLVESVRPGSPAARMGLERNDVIVAVGGRSIEDPSAAVEALRAAGRDTGTPFSVEVIRAGKRLTLSR
jgi:membrane-associated protease RseP (regulator of RpoE activity)